MYDVVEQLSCLFCYGLDKGFVFNPLGEHVDADIDLVKSSWRGLERPDHIQSPACKGPRRKNHLQGLGRDVDFLSKKLTILTPANECLSISNR